MKKYRYALLAVLAAMLICLNGCTDDVSVAVEPDDTYSVSSTLIDGYTKNETEPNTDPVHTVSSEPMPSLKSTGITSQETASENVKITPPVTPMPSPETAIAADLNIVPPVSPIPSPESASDTNPAAAPTVSPVPSPEPASKATPTPAETQKTGSDFIYPIQTFNDKTRICLTFDDGGSRKAVQKALEVLKKHDLKCTFFVVGKYMKANEALFKQAAEEGHIICNHTQNHKWLADLSNEDAKKEILEWESTVVEILGQEYLDRMKQEFPFIRLPGGSGNESKRILRIVAELGYIPVGWNLETYYAVLRHHDLNNEPVTLIANEVLAHVTKKVKGGSIILLHFNAYDTEKLDEIITAIKDKNLTMHQLNECLEY